MVASHAEDPFVTTSDAAAGLVCEVLGTNELLLKAVHVVVLEHKALALVQTNAVHHAGMRLTVVHNDIVARHERLNGGLASLVTKVEQERIFLLHEVCEFLFKGFVFGGLARHHAGAHGVAHAPLSRSFCIDFADFWVVGKTEVVVDAPNKKLFSSEGHAVADFSLQLGEG